jgi:hypothetical protein
MHADLKWLAKNEPEWAMDDQGYMIIRRKNWACYVESAEVDGEILYGRYLAFTKAQHQAARDELEDPFSSPEEDEAWQAAEKRMDIIGHNGSTGDHYESPASKYHVQIKGQWVDVYDILTAYSVTNPADAHAIKKMLCPGRRGAKDGIQDRQEAIVSLQRAIELEGGL